MTIEHTESIATTYNTGTRRHGPSTGRLAHTLRRTACFALACAVVAPLGGCGTASDDAAGTDGGTDTIRVAYLSTANYLTTLKDQDYTEEAMKPYGIEFSGPFNPPDDAYKTVLAGRADTSSTGTGHFINMVSQGSPWVAYAIEYYDGDSQGIVAAPDSGVERLEDLYGKRVGIDRKGATGDYALKAAFTAAGLDYSKVEEVELSQKDFSAAFTSGKIDALATYDQNLAAAIATPGAKLLVDGTDYGSRNVSLHMVSRKFAKAHPEIVRQLYRTLVRESDQAQQDSEFIYETYRKFGASDAIVDQVRKFDVPEILPVDDKGRRMLEDIAQQYVDFGFIESKPDLTGYVLDCTE